MRIDEHGDLRVKYLDPEGPTISTPDDASDLIGNAWVENVGLLAVPVSRLDAAFFDLSSGVAGEFTQKLVNYQLRLAVIGDVSAFESASGAFRDWVWESNRGRHVWFVADGAALKARLAAG
jgi:hypothetical protein